MVNLSQFFEFELKNVWSTGTDADTSAYDVTSYGRPPGIKITGIGRQQAFAYSPPSTPAMDFFIPNWSGVYSPGGVLGGFVNRGPKSTFKGEWGTDVLGDATDIVGDSTEILGDGRPTFSFFDGTIDTAPQKIDIHGRPGVQVRSLGSTNKLLRHKPITILYENVQISTIIHLLLDIAGWDSSLRQIDETDTVLNYWWLNGQTDILQAIRILVATEGVPSCAYEDQYGVFHFEGRQRRQLSPRSVEDYWFIFDGTATNNATGDDAVVTGDAPDTFGDGLTDELRMYVIPTEWSSNPDEVVGDVTTSTNVRTPAALPSKVWELGGTLTLTPLQTIDIPVTNSNPFKSAITPVSGTDYSLLSGTLTAVSLLTTSGQTVTLRLTAGGGGTQIVGATSSGIQVRATLVPVTTTNNIASTVDTDLSQARFEPKEYTLALWPEIAYNDALDRVNNFARRYQRPRDRLSVIIANITWQHAYMIANARISDKIKIRHTHGSINNSFFIERMSYDLTRGGGLIFLILDCERATEDEASLFGTARFGLNNFSG